MEIYDKDREMNRVQKQQDRKYFKNINALFSLLLGLAIINKAKLNKESMNVKINALIEKKQDLVNQSLIKIEELIDHVKNNCLDHIGKQDFDSCPENYGGREYIIGFLKGDINVLLEELEALTKRLKTLDVNQNISNKNLSIETKLIYCELEISDLNKLVNDLIPSLNITKLDPVINFSELKSTCWKLNSNLCQFFDKIDDEMILMDDVDDQAILDEIKKVWPSIFSKRLEEATKYNKGSPPQAAGYSLLKQNCLF